MKKIIIVLPLAAVLLLVAYRCVVSTFSEFGTGEGRNSPNERFEASAMSMSSENFWGQQKHWFTFEVKEKRTKRIIEKIVTEPLSGPYFGSRSNHQVVFWADDSSFVEFRFPRTEIRIITGEAESQPVGAINSEAAASPR